MMEDTRVLLGKVNVSLKKNLGKIIIALLLVFLASGALAPLAMVLLEVGLIPLALLVLLVVPLLLFMLQISFAQMCAKLYRDEPCVLGNLLDSFRDWRRCGMLAIVYAFTAIVVCVVIVQGCVMVSFLASGSDAASFYGEDILASMISFMPVVVMVCMAIFFLLVLLPTSFAHLVLADNREMPFLSAIQENFRLLKGRRMWLAGFLLRAGGLWLVGAVVFLVASFSIVSVMFHQPETAQVTLSVLRIASQICDMLYFICVYTILIRLETAVAAFYQALRDEEAGKDVTHQLPDSASPQA